MTRRLPWVLGVVLAAAVSASGGEPGEPIPAVGPGVHPRLVVQTGTAAFLEGIAISPDGSLVVTADGARLWDVATGRELGRLAFDRRVYAQRGLSRSVHGVRFLPDGKRVLTCGPDSIVRLWDLATLATVREFTGHTGQVRALAVSPDGKRALTGGEDRTVRLWDVATGAEVRRFDGHASEVMSVAIAPDGEYVFAGGKDGTLRRWPTSVILNAEAVVRLPGIIGILSISPDGTRAIAGCSGLESSVWRLFPLEKVCKLAASAYHGASWSADGTRVLAVGGKELVICDAASGRELSRQAIDPLWVFATSFTADGRLMAINGSDDRGSSYAAKVWDVPAGREVRRLRGYNDFIMGLGFSPDGKHLLMAKQDGTTSLWDLTSGGEVHRFASPRLLAVSPDGRRVATGGPSTLNLQVATVWDFATRRPLGVIQTRGGYIGRGEFTSDGEAFLTFVNDGRGAMKAQIWDIKTGREARPLAGTLDDLFAARVTPDGRHVLRVRGRSLTTLDLATGEEVRRVEFGPPVINGPDLYGDPIQSGVFSPDLRRLLTVHRADRACIWDTDTGTRVCELAGFTGRAAAIEFLPGGKLVVAGLADGTARSWDAATGREVARFEGHTVSMTNLAVSADGRTVASSDSDQNTCLWDARTGREIARLVSFRDGDWIVIGPDGRFDTNDLDGVVGLHWVFPDDPFRTLQPEVFLRDYYEPRLLARLLAGEAFRPIRPLGELNRVQPPVRIAAVRAGQRPDVAEVTVEVGAGRGRFAGGRVERQTDAYDLRLFRDGQLVAVWPEDDDLSAEDPDPTSPRQMAAWRDMNRIPLDPASGRASRTFHVPLPHRDGPRAAPIEFSAYAFNEDRVKSVTARVRHDAPALPPGGRPRAYLICMGVGASQNPDWDLRFAADDARLIAAALGDALRRAGRYEVVPILLISERTAGVGPGGSSAKKAALKAVLDRLDGRPGGAADAARWPGLDSVRASTPDDLIVFSFSGHGYTDARGILYLLPHDVGDGRRPLGEVLPRCISSAELSSWFSGVDAGELVLIVDACHSAAAVRQPGFKPGPLGGRGLGQLAYDKGMRVLAASQADAVALESRAIRQGLLTYALARDGLEQRRAEKDGELTLGGLLSYAAERVPSLYHEVRSGQVRDVAGRAAPDVVVRELAPPDKGRTDGATGERQLVPAGRVADAVQHPELFDYHRGSSDAVLAR